MTQVIGDRLLRLIRDHGIFFYGLMGALVVWCAFLLSAWNLLPEDRQVHVLSGRYGMAELLLVVSLLFPSLITLFVHLDAREEADGGISRRRCWYIVTAGRLTLYLCVVMLIATNLLPVEDIM